MRVAFGELYQETDTFSPVRTGIESFETYGLYQGNELLEHLVGVEAIGGFLEVIREQRIRCDLFPLSRAWAAAGGIILQTAFDQLLDMLIKPLQAHFLWMAFFFPCVVPASLNTMMMWRARFLKQFAV